MPQKVDTIPFHLMLERVVKNGLCLEIGTFKGNGSRQILNHCNPSLLISIDPYLEYTKERNFSADPGYGNQKDHVQRYLETQLNMLFESRYRLIRALSNEVLPMLPKNSFQLVYIDGAHLEDQVYKDINNSLEILAPEGVIICDDYLVGPKKKDFGVNEAVERIINEGKLIAVTASDDKRFKKIMLTRSSS